eukprot:scaffold57905_cov36-Prasinocladus_malaysianus.AAC.2
MPPIPQSVCMLQAGCAVLWPLYNLEGVSTEAMTTQAVIDNTRCLQSNCHQRSTVGCIAAIVGCGRPGGRQAGKSPKSKVSWLELFELLLVMILAVIELDLGATGCTYSLLILDTSAFLAGADFGQPYDCLPQKNVYELNAAKSEACSESAKNPKTLPRLLLITTMLVVVAGDPTWPEACFIAACPLVSRTQSCLK